MRVCTSMNIERGVVGVVVGGGSTLDVMDTASNGSLGGLGLTGAALVGIQTVTDAAASSAAGMIQTPIDLGSHHHNEQEGLTHGTYDSSMTTTEGDGDPNFQAADSNSPKQTFVPCKVCGDKASGYHYGVTSCEGCKGFFRRSIQKQIEYRCLRDGKCLVIRLNRNRCQYCRFKKCLAVGMSRDFRYGRVPKRSKSTDEQRVTTTDNQEQSALESKQLAIYDVILTISQAHHGNSVLTEDKVKAMVRKPVSLFPVKTEGDNQLMFTSESVEQHRFMMYQNLAVLITPTIQRVVEFAKRVPGFPELSQDDQLILIKSGFFEIWLTRVSRMFNSTENTLTFGDGSVVSRDQIEIVYTADVVDGLFEYASGFELLHLNDTEIGLFTAVVLATIDRPGLTDQKAVERIQDKLIEALKLQISRNHSTEPQLFATILMKLPELRTLGAKHAEQLQYFRQQWSQLKLPPLYAEIYDIPKNEDDLQS